MDPRIFRNFLDQLPQFILQTSELAQQEEQSALDRQARSTEVRESQQFRAIEAKKQRDFQKTRDEAQRKQEDKILIGENLGPRAFGSFLLADDDPENDILARSYLARADQEDTEKMLARIERAASQKDPAARVAALSAIEIPDSDFSDQINALIEASQGEVDNEAALQKKTAGDLRIRQLQSVLSSEALGNISLDEDASEAFMRELQSRLQGDGPPAPAKKAFQPDRFFELLKEGKSRIEAFGIMQAEGFEPIVK